MFRRMGYAVESELEFGQFLEHFPLTARANHVFCATGLRPGHAANGRGTNGWSKLCVP
jgi:hypothetical protein